MEIASAVQSAASSVSTSDKSESARAAADSDFHTFLTLLTAQIRNQDPLEPMDSTQFVAQLASFSAVEQQIQGNTKLDAIFDALSGSTGDALAGWIGKEVRAAASAQFDDSPIEVHANPVEGADTAHLVVRDASGGIVAGLTVDAGASVVSWNGQTELGFAPPGLYSFSIESFKEGSFLESRPGQVFSAVEEARDENGKIILILQGGARLSANDVEAVRAAARTV